MFEVSGQDLINIANENINGETNKIKSKFAIIIATAKRARQLVDNKDDRVKYDNPLTVAIDEFKNKEVTIYTNDEV